MTRYESYHELPDQAAQGYAWTSYQLDEHRQVSQTRTLFTDRNSRPNSEDLLDRQARN